MSPGLEIARFLLVTTDRRALTSHVMDALIKGRFLQDGFDVDAEQAERAAAKLPAGRIDDTAIVVAAITGPARSGDALPLFVYFRLRDPSEKAQALPPVVDPLEAWITTDLTDPSGQRVLATLRTCATRAHPRFSAPWQLTSPGGSLDLPPAAEVLEIRTTLPNAEYLAKVLDQIGATTRATAALIAID
jgi:hypothetical protein